MVWKTGDVNGWGYQSRVPREPERKGFAGKPSDLEELQQKISR